MSTNEQGPGTGRDDENERGSDEAPAPRVGGILDWGPRHAKALGLEAGGAPGRSRTLRPSDGPLREYTGEQRLLLLDTWLRSKLPATDFAPLVGVAVHTLYAWRKRCEDAGPAGLLGHRKGARGSRLPEPTRRAILMMKEQHPDWGQDRIHDMLLRSQGLEASAGAVQRVLVEAGYEVEPVATRPHEPKAVRFERAEPNALWQTDLFTFLLKRERRRVWLVAYLDDFSRFVVGFGLHASASGALVREVFEAAIANHGAPLEVLTDNGTQYATWRGKSAFTKLCERRGIRQIVASPRRPQTLGKVERFWGTLWRELLEGAIFQGLDEARERIGHFLGWYNFQRTHQGIEGLVPADRYFGAAPEVLATLKARVAQNAKDLALHGVPRQAMYLTGRVGEESISLHGEGTKVVLTRADGQQSEVELSAPGRRQAPGTSELDEVLEDVVRIRRQPEVSADEAAEDDHATDDGDTPDDEAVS